MNEFSQRSGVTLRLAGVMGFVAVALGAFGAHGLEEWLGELGTAEIWEVAVFYNLTHAVASLWASGRRPLAAHLWFAGTLIFSGSLYILALTNLRWLGAVTPIGGLLLLAGWAVLVFSPRDPAPPKPEPKAG